jgi:hypothetical protein
MDKIFRITGPVAILHSEIEQAIDTWLENHGRNSGVVVKNVTADHLEAIRTPDAGPIAIGDGGTVLNIFPGPNHKVDVRTVGQVSLVTIEPKS